MVFSTEFSQPFQQYRERSFDKQRRLKYDGAFMSSRCPEIVDPWRVSEQKQTFTGSVQLGDLPRLSPLLSRSEGCAEYHFLFTRDQHRRPLIEGHVEARLWQQCQRCLGEMSIDVDSDFRLVVVQGLDEAEQLETEFDPLLAEEGEIRLIELVEDELLLSLPVVPLHPACEGIQYDDDNTIAEEPRENPFAALKALKDSD